MLYSTVDSAVLDYSLLYNIRNSIIQHYTIAKVAIFVYTVLYYDILYKEEHPMCLDGHRGRLRGSLEQIQRRLKGVFDGNKIGFPLKGYLKGSLGSFKGILQGLKGVLREFHGFL